MDPANYRPISLTSILCKLCEHIIHCAIIRHFDENNVLSDAQHGFRQRRSCETQEEAFDKVSHRHLLKKIHHYGDHDKTLDWISDFLNSRTQSVVVDGQTSEESFVTSGVPQGSVLGLLLFLAFINDLPVRVSSSTTRLFAAIADDSVLYRRINCAEDSAKLQDDLDTVQVWEQDWLMSFNASKCQVLQITNKSNPIRASYFIHGQELETVKSAKYIGVTLDNKLKFN